MSVAIFGKGFAFFIVWEGRTRKRQKLNGCRANGYTDVTKTDSQSDRLTD